MNNVIIYFSTHPSALVIAAYLLGVNVVVFLLCAADKYKAAHNKWRIREKTFFTLSIIGGSPFMLLGMYLFRHKTKHPEFTICIPMILALQIVLVVYLQYKYGLIVEVFI